MTAAAIIGNPIYNAGFVLNYIPEHKENQFAFHARLCFGNLKQDKHQHEEIPK
jgi:hypothetical protein